MGSDGAAGPRARPLAPAGPDELLEVFGQVDIYLFDQLLRGRITPSHRILDAGCGSGRNAHYLMRCGADVHCVDENPEAVGRVRELVSRGAPRLPPDNVRQVRLEALPYADEAFDAVICSAVLHFAEGEPHFEAMVREMWRVLRPGGTFFARLASTIGLGERLRKRKGRWYTLPDGSDRFLVDEDYLMRISAELGAELLDPIKTTNVQNLRAMTTWVLGKGEVT